MEAARDGSHEIIREMTAKLISDFDVSQVSGLEEKPIITDTVTSRTPEPYVYFYNVDSSEAWVTKDSESRQYNIVAQVMVRDDVGRGTNQQRDQISNQVLSHLTDQTDYPDVSGHGYGIQLVRSGDIVKYQTSERGGKYFVSNIPLQVTARYNGFDVAVAPVASQSFTFTNFDYTPVNRRIEMYDAGTITVGSSYPNSNGWNLENSTVAKSAGHADGTLTGRALTLTSRDENIGLTTTFNWQQIDDNSTKRVTTDTDNFTRIKSLRYGSVLSSDTPVFTDDSATNFGLQRLSNFDNIDYNHVSPVGRVAAFDADAGEYLYIMYDANEPALTEAIEDVFNQNILEDEFNDPVIVGGWRIYTSVAPIPYNDVTLNYTLG